VEVEGLDHVPPGGALIVANHTFGFDIVFPMGAIFQTTGRVVWALGEHAWWKWPFLRRLAAAVGTVDGTRDNADALLGRDQLVLVLPGGLRESMKPRELRYRLLWRRRYGFVRAAIRNQVPIVPLAAIGADEIFELVGNAFVRGNRFGFPLPRPWAGVPIPHRVALRYVLGEPLVPRARPDEADDPDVLRRVQREVKGALEELIDEELAKRAGFDIA
jgi:1-acyl-sn-glycerol-3-phosphate acyltransferase